MLESNPSGYAPKCRRGRLKSSRPLRLSLSLHFGKCEKLKLIQQLEHGCREPSRLAFLPKKQVNFLAIISRSPAIPDIRCILNTLLPSESTVISTPAKTEAVSKDYIGAVREHGLFDTQTPERSALSQILVTYVGAQSVQKVERTTSRTT